MKSSIPHYTRDNSVYTSMKSLSWYISSYTIMAELSWVILSYTWVRIPDVERWRQTVELVKEKGNLVHSRWHSQPKESELSEVCAAPHFYVAAKDADWVSESLKLVSHLCRQVRPSLRVKPHSPESVTSPNERLWFLRFEIKKEELF
jgi:hypothetical protein